MLALVGALLDFEIGAEFPGGGVRGGSGEAALLDFKVLEGLVVLFADRFFGTEQIEVGGDGGKAIRQGGQTGEF